MEKFVDKNGLIYFTQLLHKGLEQQIKKTMTEQAVTVTDFEKRLTDLAAQKAVVSETVLDQAVADIKALITSTTDALKANLESEIKSQALAAVEEKMGADVASKVSDKLDDAIADGTVMSTATANATFMPIATANSTFVKKAGDTMTGTLNGTNIVASGNVKAGTFTTASGIIFS